MTLHPRAKPRPRRLFAPFAVGVVIVALAGGGVGMLRLLDYSTSYFHEANAALDLEGGVGRLAGANWDLVRTPATPQRLAAAVEARQAIVADLAMVRRGNHDREDYGLLLVQADAFVAASTNEWNLVAEGFPMAAGVAAEHNDAMVMDTLRSSDKLVAELRRNADRAAGDVRLGVAGLSLLLILTVGGMGWWAARRRRASERIKIEADTTARYEAIVEHGADIVALTDAGGAVSYVSPTMGSLLGYSDPSATPALISLVHPDDVVVVAQLLEVAATSGGAGPADYRVHHADGTWRTMELTIKDLRGIDTVGALVWTSRDVTDRRRLEDDLAKAAFEDSLTHLANRALFLDRLDQAIARAERHRGPVAVLLADLDGFKEVNDGLGHQAGDEVLIEVARRIVACVRPGDTVARMGGDEFTILLEDMPNAGYGELVAQRVLEAVREPVTVNGAQLRPGISIGISTSGAGCASGVDMLRNADTAMYTAKNAGRGRSATFEPIMQERVQEHLRIASELGEALDRSELEVYYQPTFTLDGHRIQGAEALVRWNHPQRGLVLPGVFIPVAEQTGQILPIGRWVLSQACAQASEWQRDFPTSPTRSISVNLSARKLADRNIVADIKAILASTRLDPQSLILEITESVLMDDVPAACKKLAALKDIGVRLAIDDFGTGYSSLAYLKQFPVDILKIDRAFTEAAGRIDGLAFLRAIVDLGTSLHLTTVAEGIEIEEQADQLQLIGCGVGQGFWFARPMPAADLTALLDAPVPALI